MKKGRTGGIDNKGEEHALKKGEKKKKKNTIGVRGKGTGETKEGRRSARRAACLAKNGSGSRLVPAPGQKESIPLPDSSYSVFFHKLRSSQVIIWDNYWGQSSRLTRVSAVVQNAEFHGPLDKCFQRKRGSLQSGWSPLYINTPTPLDIDVYKIQLKLSSFFFFF